MTAAWNTPAATAEFRAEVATCRRDHRDAWRVLDRRANHSAFNGYHRTPSDYSGVRCVWCGRYWRTKAAYVDALPDAEPTP